MRSNNQHLLLVMELSHSALQDLHLAIEKNFPVGVQRHSCLYWNLPRWILINHIPHNSHSTTRGLHKHLPWSGRHWSSGRLDIFLHDHPLYHSRRRGREEARMRFGSLQHSRFRHPHIYWSESVTEILRLLERLFLLRIPGTQKQCRSVLGRVPRSFRAFAAAQTYDPFFSIHGSWQEIL